MLSQLKAMMPEENSLVNLDSIRTSRHRLEDAVSGIVIEVSDFDFQKLAIEIKNVTLSIIAREKQSL